MHVETATINDISAWLALAAEVEPLFGPLIDTPEFNQALRRNIDRGSAFCVRAEGEGILPGAPIMGGLLFSAHPPHYRIGWLAVARRWQHHGVGRALVEHALGLIQSPADLSVITFGDDVPGGEDARRFYYALGFDAAEPAPAAPNGDSRQVFRLRMD